MHVPPKGFVRIRHYGILSNQNKRRLIPICRNLVGCREFLRRVRKDDKVHAIRILYKKDVTVCPCCGGSMSYEVCTEWNPKRSSAWPQSNRIWDIRFGGKGEVCPKQGKLFRNLAGKYLGCPSTDGGRGHWIPIPYATLFNSEKPKVG